MFEGEMLIIQPHKSDQVDSDKIAIKDFSLRKRIPTQKANETLKFKQKKDNSTTKL